MAPLPRKKAAPSPVVSELNPFVEGCMYVFLGLLLAWFTQSSWSANHNRPNSGWVELTTGCGLLALTLFLLACSRFRRWKRHRSSQRST